MHEYISLITTYSSNHPNISSPYLELNIYIDLNILFMEKIYFKQKSKYILIVIFIFVFAFFVKTTLLYKND